LPEERKLEVLAVESAKAVAETEASVGLGFLTAAEDGPLWDVMRMPNLSDDQRATMLAEEAKRLVAEKMAAQPELTASQQWALREGLDDSF
jgi:hypothetical protein